MRSDLVLRWVKDSRRLLQVVYLTEPIDEVTIQNLAKYGEHTFVDVSKEEIDLGEDEDEKAKASAAHMLMRRMSSCSSVAVTAPAVRCLRHHPRACVLSLRVNRAVAASAMLRWDVAAN